MSDDKENDKENCPCGEPAMVGFDACAQCFQHATLIACIERRFEARIRRAWSEAESIAREHDESERAWSEAESIARERARASAALIGNELAAERDGPPSGVGESGPPSGGDKPERNIKDSY